MSGGARRCRTVSRLFRTFIALCCAAVLAHSAGCASSPVPYELPSPPSEAVRSRFGTIAVVPLPYAPRTQFTLPAKGALAGAGRKSEEWASSGFWGPLEGLTVCRGNEAVVCVPLFFSMAVVGGTLGGVAGGVTGAITAESKEKVEAAEAVLTEAASARRVQETLGERIVRQAVLRTQRHLELAVPANGGSETELFRALAARGVDTALEVGISDLVLAAPWETNPPLRLILDAQVKVVRIADARLLYDASFRYRGTERTFVAWAADNARPLNTDLERAYAALSEKIVDELFLLVILSPGSKPAKGDGP